MGIQGTLEYLSDVLSSAKKGKKKKQMQTVAVKIRMDCAKSVDVDLKQQKATVTGYNVEAKKVLKAAQSTKKKCELWPYVPYNLVAHPYISQAYDKKAPPNMVRKVADTSNITETAVDDRYIVMFSDDNPNACSVM
ncbi:heavy metal-associated isoprenylated plant protein 26-like [Pyrus ussuriensis x Pyrus communis]|uniref:Heavy metal-associated isoprenylated plant protein 26-like n=1 Tax=Pyrus ussuriensis x Pyrus communis TaxID=2448454 RepID=A0A5N5HMF0_9ROSA|nr:heavy metal-associated isoprenylated plant protein 26-like [Pyrus ussuriensis x Pyrus communis]